jgi:hypothetical protein
MLTIGFKIISIIIAIAILLIAISKGWVNIL